MSRTPDQRLPVGVPLLVALLQEVTPDVRMRLDDIGEGATKHLMFRPDDDVGTWYYRHKFEKDFEKKLESGELSLDVALKQFEEGVRLSRLCQQHLAAAEQRVEILTKVPSPESPEGLELRPFTVPKA